MLGELHGKARDAAGAALDQDGFAVFEVRRVFDGRHRGEADEPERRRLGMAERGGLLGDDGRLDGDLLGIGAFDALVGHAEHGVAGFEIGDAGADVADDAGEVAAENVRKPVEFIAAAAAPDLGVGAVDAGRVDIDHHLAGPGLRVRRLAETQHLRPAVARQKHCFHAFSSAGILGTPSPNRHERPI